MKQVLLFIALLYFSSMLTQEHSTISYVEYPLITTICNLVENDALASLISGQLNRLDAQVGDFQCYGRATYLLELYKKTFDDSFSLESLSPLDKRFLSLCYLFTLSKKTAKIGLRTIREIVDESILKKKFHIGSKKALRIKRYGQEELAHLTINYLMEQTKSQIPELCMCMEIIPSGDAIFKRSSLLHFPSIIVMLKQLMKQAIPVRVTINQLCDSCVKHEHLLELLFIHRPELSLYECIHTSIDGKESINLEQLSPHQALITAHFFNPNEVYAQIKSSDTCQCAECFIETIRQLPIEKILIHAAGEYPYYRRQDINPDTLPLMHEVIKKNIGPCCQKKKTPRLILQHIYAQSFEEIKAKQEHKIQMPS